MFHKNMAVWVTLKQFIYSRIRIVGGVGIIGGLDIVIIIVIVIRDSRVICKTFENHESIKEIRKSLIESAPPIQSKTQAFVSSENVKKLLKT